MSGPPPASATARDETNRGLNNGRNPGPVRRCTTRCPAGTSTNAPLNGADRNKRNSFLARPAKNLIRKISDSCKLCRDLCAYRGDDDMIAAQSLRSDDDPIFIQVIVSIRFFATTPLIAPASWRRKIPPRDAGGIPIDRATVTVWNGAHEASARPASEPGALHRRRPS
ncbi:uncharacterized protein AruCF_2565 [Achromobacter ruhlandii]|nr:uncharacterized protein AruCF_2565 [Achromobacter ruhlandii]